LLKVSTECYNIFMSQVEFEEENQLDLMNRGFDDEAEGGGFVIKALIHSGLAKTKAQANIVMIIMIIILIGIMVFALTR
jgi:hypothetical protein